MRPKRDDYPLRLTIGESPLFSFLRKGSQVASVTGLALSPDAIAFARCVRRPNEVPRIELCESRAMAAADRAKLLPALAREFQLDRMRCVSVMDGNGFSLLLVEAPQVEAAELRAAVRWRIKDLLDFHVDDAVIDVPGQEQRGRPRLMYVVAARVSTVRQEIDLLEGSGIQLAAIDIPELCQRNIAALLPEDQTGVAVLHLNGSSGLLTLTRAGSLYLSRTLEVGATQLLAANGDAQEPSDVLMRMLDGVVLEVQRSLDYYESHFSLPPIATLAVAPTARPIPGLVSHLAANLGVAVRSLDLNAVLHAEHPLSDAHQADCFFAIGAALRREEKAL
jgi:MSHA biogenesis protein MshI